VFRRVLIIAHLPQRATGGERNSAASGSLIVVPIAHLLSIKVLVLTVGSRRARATRLGKISIATPFFIAVHVAASTSTTSSAATTAAAAAAAAAPAMYGRGRTPSTPSASTRPFGPCVHLLLVRPSR